MHWKQTFLPSLLVLVVASSLVSSQPAYPPGVPPRADQFQQPPPPQQQQQYQQQPPQQQQQYQQQPPQQQQQYQQQPPQQQQQYQQQPPQQQQFQQQPPQQQQQQQQQPPYQQQQQQQQQPNVQQFQQNPNNVQGQGHGHGHEDSMKFKADIHNAEHIMEHLQEVIDTKPKEQMTEEELEFHYFKMHDYDGNNKLDGVEIGKALTHFHGEDSSDHSANAEPPKVVGDTELAETVDNVLELYDFDRDGYIVYTEYKTGKKRNEATED